MLWYKGWRENNMWRALFSVWFLSIQDTSESELFEAFGNEAQEIGGGWRVEDERPVHLVQLQMRGG